MSAHVVVIAQPPHGAECVASVAKALQGHATVTLHDGRFDRRRVGSWRKAKLVCHDAADYVACHAHRLDALLMQRDGSSATAAAALRAFCDRPGPGRTLLPSRLAEHLRKRAGAKVPPRPAHTLAGEPLVSIITVVRNDAPGLSHTLRSVFEQSRQDFEYLVIDGASTDHTLALVREHAPGIDRWISESDRGPYDAMTKGARLARGRYVLFMNAGDEFSGPLALEEALHGAPDDADMLCGHHLYLRRSGRCELRPAADLADTYAQLRAGRLSAQWLAGIPCHQSTFVARRHIVERGFDPRFRIAADHALLFALMAGGARTHATGTCVARYAAGGMSRKQLDVCQSDWEHIALEHTADPAAVRAFYDAMKAR